MSRCVGRSASVSVRAFACVYVCVFMFIRTPARFCQCVCVPERGKRENTCTLMPVSEVPGESIRRVQYKAKCQTVYMITPPDTPPPPAVYSSPTHLSVAKFQNLFFGSFHSLGGCVST